jgi:hypothetical protein
VEAQQGIAKRRKDVRFLKAIAVMISVAGDRCVNHLAPNCVAQSGIRLDPEFLTTHAVASYMAAWFTGSSNVRTNKFGSY